MSIKPILRPGAPFFLCGEAPGPEEELAGLPFVGKSGRKLDLMLSKAGIDRSECSISNVMLEAPQGGYDSEHFVKEFYETVEDPIITKTGKVSKKTRKTIVGGARLQAGYSRLRREVEDSKCNVIVAVGNEALKALTGVSGITQYRGSSLHYPGSYTKVIPILHPSGIMRSAQWEDFWVTVKDLKKAKRWAEGKAEVLYPTFYTSPDCFQAGQFLLNVAAHKEPWSLDIEIRGGSIACFAVCLGNFAMCIPIQATYGPYFTAEEELEVWSCLDVALRRNPLLIGQNISFDLDHLASTYGLMASGVYMDTITAQKVLEPELPAGLDFLCSWWLDDCMYYKDEGKTWKPGSKVTNEQLWEYNCKDAFYTLQVAEKQEEELRRRGQWDRFQNYFMKLYPVGMEMQLLGLDADVGEMVRYRDHFQAELKQAHEATTKVVGWDLNVRSGPACNKYVYEQLKLPKRKNRTSGALTTNEKVLQELLVRYPDMAQGLRPVVRERHLRKALSDYLTLGVLE